MIYLPVDKETSRLVMDCLAYNGEDHIFYLKLLITSVYVNYYILTESLWTQTGLPNKLRFNYTKFDHYE